MRIIAPYTERSDENQECLAVLYTAGFKVESFKMTDDLAYGRLLADLWAEGETWLNIEHDIFGVTPEIVREFETCPEEWCSSPYFYFGMPVSGTPGGGLGCTKFGAQLMARWPGMMTQAMELPYTGHPPWHWCGCDWRIYYLLRHGGLYSSEWPAERHQTHTEVQHRAGPPSHGCRDKP